MDVIRRSFLALILVYSSLFAGTPKEIFISGLIQAIMKAKKSFANDNIIIGIPNSLILGQASLESDDGNSPLARKFNNYFGLTGQNGYLKFDSMTESVRTYLKTLKTHKAYKGFRNARLRGENNPHKLIDYIAKSYAEDKNYAKKVKGRISEHLFTRFDFIPLVPKKDSETINHSLFVNNEICVSEDNTFDINEALNMSKNTLKVFNESIQQESPL
ncbi:MAG: glucosaminidase domain-containing protein [Candidatus Gracilibacteria bacterium]|nr:glucosaminidase domain-containing protein [Candidatus Gracilibacteria bacterium]